MSSIRRAIINTLHVSFWIASMIVDGEMRSQHVCPGSSAMECSDLRAWREDFTSICQWIVLRRVTNQSHQWISNNWMLYSDDVSAQREWKTARREIRSSAISIGSKESESYLLSIAWPFDMHVIGWEEAPFHSTLISSDSTLNIAETIRSWRVDEFI